MLNGRMEAVGTVEVINLLKFWEMFLLFVCILSNGCLYMN